MRATALEADGRDRTLVWGEVGLRTKPTLTLSCLEHITQVFPASEIPSFGKRENNPSLIGYFDADDNIFKAPGTYLTTMFL